MRRPARRYVPASLLAAVLTGLAGGAAFAQPASLVRARDVAPGIAEDMKYAGPDNFTGRKVPGYEAGTCWLTRPAAQALAAAQEAAAREGLRLLAHDCYRPQRATAAFVRWARDLSDQSTKPNYYPRVAKMALFAQGYIGRFSSHSSGVAIDLTLQKADGSPLEFGTPFDYFDPMSSTDAPVNAEARANRLKLKTIMEVAGFQNYAREWWHYTYPSKAAPAFDDVIRK